MTFGVLKAVKNMGDVAKRHLASASHRNKVRDKASAQSGHSRPRLTNDIALIGSRLLGLHGGTSGRTGWAVSSSGGLTLGHVFDGKQDSVISISHC